MGRKTKCWKLSYAHNVWKVEVLVIQLCPTLCNPMDSSKPDSSVHGILQARILEWVAMLSSRGSSWPMDWTWVSCIAGRFFTRWPAMSRRVKSIVSRKKTTCHWLVLCERAEGAQNITLSCWIPPQMVLSRFLTTVDIWGWLSLYRGAVPYITE